jgi:para-nitrobenzyl esterase
LEVARFDSRKYSDNNGPVADGRVIPEVPFNPSAPRISANVPMLIGHTLNEGLGPNANAVRELWTEADMKAELAKQPAPIPNSVVEALRFPLYSTTRIGARIKRVARRTRAPWRHG